MREKPPSVTTPQDTQTRDQDDLERAALAPTTRAARWLSDARAWRWAVGTLLLGLTLLLIAVTPLSQALAQVVFPPPPAPTITPAPTATAPLVLDWSALEARPLHLPALAAGAACPASPVRSFNPNYGLGLGDGPVYPFAFTPDGQPASYDPPRQAPDGSQTPGFTNVFWAIAPDYRGVALVRGSQLDGPFPLLFNGGYAQRDNLDWTTAPLLGELQLVGDGGWSTDGSYLRLRGPGCYAFQIDGASFSQVLVFQVKPEPKMRLRPAATHVEDVGAGRGGVGDVEGEGREIGGVGRVRARH